jgi:ribosomal protein S18 acetylase RimI-like enzyme
MSISSLDIRKREISEEVWALQHPAYRMEAALIGVANLPPLQDTVQTLQSCGESFLGFRNEDGELVGAVSYEREQSGRLAICRLMVHPDSIRRGIGTLLLQSLIDAESAETVWSVTAEVRNYPAIRLYERFGFERRETFKPIPGIELVRMLRSGVPVVEQDNQPPT